MEKVVSTERVPIKMWTEDIDETALKQAKQLANLPFVFKHVALMPDVHGGYGMPIGGVLATKGVIIPNAVGVDIGCGMCAVKTSLTHISLNDLKDILGGNSENKGGIRVNIPTGRGHNTKEQSWEGFNDVPEIPVIQEQLSSAKKQLGSLGGGNHFIEIQKGSDNHIWIMIHSGSRNLGYRVAKHYNKVAQELCKLWYSNIPEPKGEDGLAFLPLNSKEGKEYLEAMTFCVKFAQANRTLMMNKVLAEFKRVFPEIETFESINIAHNYAAMEHHFNKNVMVHRKGATKALEGQYGIIPGSQGTSSYIVKGKSNPQSFNSCSHGAGRKMSRTKAINTLNLEEETRTLDEQNILHTLRHKNSLDEAPSAYKDIDVVMENQKDLVDIHVKLTPLAVIKG